MILEFLATTEGSEIQKKERSGKTARAVVQSSQEITCCCGKKFME